MTRRTSTIAIIAIGLMCCCDSGNSAATGYYYEQPIRPFNPPTFSTLRSTGPFDGITFGQKVVASPRPRLSVPPLPSLPPLTTLTRAQPTRHPTSYFRTQPSPTTYTGLGQYGQQQAQQGQYRPQSAQFGQQQGQYKPDQGQYRPQQGQYGQDQGQYRPQAGGQEQGQYRPASQQQLRFQSTQRPQPPPLPKLQFPPQLQPFYSRTPVTTPYAYNRPQKQFPSTVQPRISPQTYPKPTARVTPRPTTAFTFKPTPIPTQRPTPKPIPRPTQRPPITQRPPAPTFAPSKVTPSLRPAVPTTTAAPVVLISNSTQAGVSGSGLLSSPDIYVINGRQLKQYKVYEHIDNDIEQDSENFIPANFFLNSYHARIGPTHPLSDNFQVQNRAGFSRSQPRSRLQASPNSIAIGSGGLGFVKLPNGNVYLGSGSLGYISSLQRIQEVEDARTRTGASSPDAVHFGHGPLSDSFYYQSQ